MATIKRLENKFIRIYNDQEKLNAQISKLESMLERYVPWMLEDGFSITYQAGDGFCLEYMANNARLSTCLAIIEAGGELTEEEYKSICI